MQAFSRLPSTSFFVTQTLLKSPVPDEAAWCVLWIELTVLASVMATHEVGPAPERSVGRWRVLHGIGAIVLYVLYHVVNHLFGLLGPDMHATVMDVGRTVYRSPLIEPILVVLMLFQAFPGIYLAWKWSAKQADFHRTFQVASGVFLSVS
jgi:hypothetical protein